MEKSIISKKNIGILYICTGPYSIFWKNFYKSFQKYFLPGYEKHYYVFTDCEELWEEGDSKYIHYYKVENQPWPLITLLRFRIFLKAEEALKKHQFLMFSNSNMICCDYIYAEDFLPDKNKQEKLFFIKHPGYYQEKPWNTPLDRNRNSLAYVPFHCGYVYVIGALFGGYASDFLLMANTLNNRICEDLKKGIIAKWHDESHINHYILRDKHYKLLSPGYCYPVGLEIGEKKKIAAVSKADKFDVNQFKGYYSDIENYSYWFRIKAKFKRNIYPVKVRIFVFRDFLLRRKIAR